ncbi:MAG: amidohydrolase [Rhodospirillales bacterium]|nr:amidohydrolase [Rhodospirillales bacterium]
MGRGVITLGGIVTPAEAGVQALEADWIPAFAGMTVRGQHTRSGSRARVIVALLACMLGLSPTLVAAPALADSRLPIFDAHIHYSRDAWDRFPPATVLDILAKAGVPRALVSSTPDDGTLMLQRADPERIVPVLRPYKNGIGSGNWFREANVPAYLEERLRKGDYVGIGEFHLFSDANADTPVVRRVVALAVERGIFLHVHSGAGPVRALFGIDPKLNILWAHAGMSEPPDVVGAALDRHANLWTEVSFRAGDIGRNGGISAAWRDVMLRHPDRFMIGSDTYVTPRWETYAQLIDEHHRWLAHLPRDVAEKIAWRNAVRLFGAGNVKEFGP